MLSIEWFKIKMFFFRFPDSGVGIDEKETFLLGHSVHLKLKGNWVRLLLSPNPSLRVGSFTSLRPSSHCPAFCAPPPPSVSLTKLTYFFLEIPLCFDRQNSSQSEGNCPHRNCLFCFVGNQWSRWTSSSVTVHPPTAHFPVLFCRFTNQPW